MEFCIFEDSSYKGYVQNDEIFVNLSSCNFAVNSEDEYIRLLCVEITKIEFHELGHLIGGIVCIHDHISNDADKILGLIGFGINYCPWCSFVDDNMGDRVFNIGKTVLCLDYSDKSKWEENDRIYEEYMRQKNEANAKKTKELLTELRKRYGVVR